MTPAERFAKAMYEAEFDGEVGVWDYRMHEGDRAWWMHLGEVAAGVVAEEPEWEYGYELIESDTRDVLTRSGAFESVEAARHRANKAHKAESDPEYPPLDVLIVRRRKAGPWEEVK